MNYKIVDFRNLVALWYNEFLPDRVGDKSVFVEDAGILYLKSISLESERKDTIKFMVDRMSKISDNGIGLFVQETKPVNNVRLQPFLRYIEELKDLSQGRKDKVFHYANRRYVPVSSNILVSQEKEIDEFLDDVFVELTKLEMQNVKAYQVRSLGIQDFIDSAISFFPKKCLSIQGEMEGEHIQVRSSNNLLEQMKSCVVNGNLDNSAKVRGYIAKCKLDLDKDMEKLV